MVFDAFVKTLWVKCVFCKSKLRGPRNKKAPAQEYYFVMVQKVGRNEGWVLCGSRDCAVRNVRLLETQEIGCRMCGKHPDHHFTQHLFWIYDMTGVPGCKLLSIFCSAQCTTNITDLSRPLAKQKGDRMTCLRICQNCQIVDDDSKRPSSKCAGCGLVYYYSCCVPKGTHWHKGHKNRCLRQEENPFA